MENYVIITTQDYNIDWFTQHVIKISKFGIITVMCQVQ